MTARPAVSVVVPTYDRLPVLREAVASVLAQTLEALELIVVDDGSTDGTAAYLASIADPRVRSLTLTRSGNVGHVRNEGAAVARGDYLAFLDSDDLWLPDKLSRQLERTRAAGARWSYTAYDHVDEDGCPAPWVSGAWRGPSGWIAEAVVSGEATVIVQTLLVERSFFEALGGFASAPWPMHEDLHLVVRLATHAPAVAIEEVLTRVRRHDGRSTLADDGWERSMALCDALLGEVDDARVRRHLRRRRARSRVEVGRRRFATGDWAAGIRCFAGAVLDGPDPLHWSKALVGGLLGRGRTANAGQRAPHLTGARPGGSFPEP